MSADIICIGAIREGKPVRRTTEARRAEERRESLKRRGLNIDLGAMEIVTPRLFEERFGSAKIKDAEISILF